MRHKGNGGMSDWEFIRAARVEQVECEQSHDVVIKVALAMDNTRSVINIRLDAWEVGEDFRDVCVAAYETSWPNASVKSFTATLFQAFVQLTRLVEDSKRDVEGRRAERIKAR
jgi:hypothetical protein